MKRVSPGIQNRIFLIVVVLPRLFGCNQGFRLKNKGHFHVKTKNENKKRAFADRVLLFTEARIVLLYLY
ncbi:MAG: hypothetical protein IKM73_14300, partial [Acidaminococcaceae bacterium]|nr:hypothetical protein [Acidaminococcaceae bacterium]